MAATMRSTPRPLFESPSPGHAIRTTRRQHLAPTSAEGPPARAKSGCWTCRLRRKKCDERQSNGTCETCARLKIDCLGWGAKRPDWLRHKEQVEAYKNQIKNQLQLTNIHKAATARNGSPKGTSAPSATRPTTATTTLDADLVFPAEDPLAAESEDTQDGDYEQNTIYEHLISPGVLSGTGTTTDYLTPSVPYVYDGVSTFTTAYGPVEAQAAAQPYQFGTDAATSSALAIPAPTGTVDVAASMPWTFGQTFDYEPRVRHFPLISDRGQTSAHVFYYFSRVRAMQYCFGGNSVTDVMHDILVREPYGVVSNAICALASAHNNLLRRSRGLEADDLSSDMSPARQFYTRAFTQMFNSRQRNNGKYTEVDATAALHFVSYWLFNGGSGDWQTALNIAGDWLEGSGVMKNGDPALAIQNLSNTGRFAAKTVIWFDIFSAITTLSPPRFLPMYKRLFRGGGGVGFWAAGLQMENVMGADDATVLAMAEIAELAAWKEEHRKAGCLSTMELTRRAAAIERDLRITSPAAPWIQTLDETTMAQLNFTLHAVPSTSAASTSTSTMSNDFAPASTAASAMTFDLPTGVQNPYVVPAPVDPTSAESSPGAEELPLPISDIELRRRATNVFREGAVLYLHTVISGCNPNVPEVSSAVKATKETLETLAPSDIDRSLVFPICLAGCMANDRTTHNFFRNRLAGYQGVGNCTQAVQLMDAVWTKRDRERVETCWRETMQELGLNLLLV